MCRWQEACCQYNYLSILTAVLDPAGQVNEPGKLCSNPKRLGLRIVQPVAVRLIPTLGWPNICNALTDIMGRRHTHKSLDAISMSGRLPARRRATQLRIEEFRRTDGRGTLGMDESVIEAVKKGTSASGQKSQNIDAESLGIRRSKFKAYEVLLNISRILSYISDHGCENDG